MIQEIWLKEEVYIFVSVEKFFVCNRLKVQNGVMYAWESNGTIDGYWHNRYLSFSLEQGKEIANRIRPLISKRKMLQWEIYEIENELSKIVNFSSIYETDGECDE